MRGNYYYLRLGKRLIHQRKRKELSQEQLGLLAAVDRTYLARIEEGKANPTISILYKISKVLKIKLSDLFKGV